LTCKNFEKDNNNNESNEEKYISRVGYNEKENSGNNINLKASESSFKNRKFMGDVDLENEAPITHSRIKEQTNIYSISELKNGSKSRIEQTYNNRSIENNFSLSNKNILKKNEKSNLTKNPSNGDKSNSLSNNINNKNKKSSNSELSNKSYDTLSSNSASYPIIKNKINTLDRVLLSDNNVFDNDRKRKNRHKKHDFTMQINSFNNTFIKEKIEENTSDGNGRKVRNNRNIKKTTIFSNLNKN
jgi:hypothetical protein